MKKRFFGILISCILVSVLFMGCGAVKNKYVFNAMESVSGSSGELKTHIVKVINTTGNDTRCGTGFFTEDGCLVAPSHLVEGDGQVQVQYVDGTTAAADVVSNDIHSDLAILKTKVPEGIQALRFADDALAEGETFSVLGYATEGAEPEEKTVAAGKEVTDGTMEGFLTEHTGDSGFIGAPILNPAGEVVGIQMTEDGRTDASIGLSAGSAQAAVQMLLADQSVDTVKTGTRQNAYTRIYEKEYGLYNLDLYGTSDYIYGEARDKSKISYRVSQTNSSLVQVKFNAANSIGDTIFGPDSLSEATAVTEEGSFTCRMNHITVLQGDKGSFLLYFPDLTGTIQKIALTNVRTIQDTEELVINMISGEEARKNAAMIQAKESYYDLLEENKEDVIRTPTEQFQVAAPFTGNPILFHDFDKDGIPEMIYTVLETKIGGNGYTDSHHIAKLVTSDGETLRELAQIQLDLTCDFPAASEIFDNCFLQLEGEDTLFLLSHTGHNRYLYEITEYAFDNHQLKEISTGGFYISHAGEYKDSLNSLSEEKTVDGYFALEQRVRSGNPAAIFGTFTGKNDYLYRDPQKSYEEQSYEISQKDSPVRVMTYEEALAYLSE